jgi:hypothetical protein
MEDSSARDPSTAWVAVFREGGATTCFGSGLCCWLLAQPLRCGRSAGGSADTVRSIAPAIYAPPAGSATKQYVGFGLTIIGGVLAAR